MGTMAVFGEGYGIFSDLLIVFRFPAKPNLTLVPEFHQSHLQCNLTYHVHNGKYGFIMGRVWNFFRCANTFWVSWSSDTL